MLTGDFSQGCPEVGDVDLVVHLAAPAAPAESIRAANQGTWYALDIARRCDAQFVLASTAHVYGAACGHRLREIDVDPMKPTDAGPIGLDQTRAAYDSARFAEALTMAYRKAFHTDTVILRVFDTYGPAMATVDARVVPTHIRQALAGEALTVTGDGHQVRSLCYVEDTVRAIVTMGASLHPGPISVDSPDEISIRHLAEQVLRLTGSSAGIRFVDRQPEDPEARCPEVSQAHALLGWKPRVELADGLERTVHSCVADRLLQEAAACASSAPYPRVPRRPPPHQPSRSRAGPRPRLGRRAHWRPRRSRASGAAHHPAAPRAPGRSGRTA